MKSNSTQKGKVFANLSRKLNGVGASGISSNLAGILIPACLWKVFLLRTQKTGMTINLVYIWVKPKASFCPMSLLVTSLLVWPDYGIIIL